MGGRKLRRNKESSSSYKKVVRKEIWIISISFFFRIHKGKLNSIKPCYISLCLKKKLKEEGCSILSLSSIVSFRPIHSSSDENPIILRFFFFRELISSSSSFSNVDEPCSLLIFVVLLAGASGAEFVFMS